MNDQILLGQRLAVGFDGLTITDDFRTLVRERKVGNVILFRRNVQSYEQLKTLCAELRTLIETETGYPPFIMIDEESGSVSRLAAIACQTPSAMAIGATGDAENARRVGEVIGECLRAVGVNFDLAPDLDCNVNPRNPVIGIRSFGSDPQLVAACGIAYAQGLQSRGIFACGKHFPGHGDTATDSHIGLPIVEKDRAEVEQTELVSFRAAVKAGIDAIMTAHVIYPALDPAHVPSTVSRPVLTGLLRQEMGFQGLIISDGMEMQAVMDLYGIEEATRRALCAGVDVALICHSCAQASATLDLLEASLAGEGMDRAEAEAAFARIVAAKERLRSAPLGCAEDFGNAAQKAACRAIMTKAVQPLHQPKGKPLPQLGKDTLFFGTPAFQTSQAADKLTLDAARLLAEHFGGSFVPDALSHRTELLSQASNRTAVLVLMGGHPQLEALQQLGCDMAQAGAQLIAVSMTTPYCLDELPDSVWKLATYEYDLFAVDVLMETLSGKCKA